MDRLDILASLIIAFAIVGGTFFLSNLPNDTDTDINIQPLETKTSYKIDNYPVDEVCIDGVVYISSFRRLAVKFNKNSTVETCE